MTMSKERIKTREESDSILMEKIIKVIANTYGLTPRDLVNIYDKDLIKGFSGGLETEKLLVANLEETFGIHINYNEWDQKVYILDDAIKFAKERINNSTSSPFKDPHCLT